MKLAGDLQPGDRIMWDGQPATVKHAQNYRTAVPLGMQTEIVVEGDSGFVASTVVDAGDWVIEVPPAPTPEQRAAARAKIESDAPAGYSHAMRMTLA